MLSKLRGQLRSHSLLCQDTDLEANEKQGLQRQLPKMGHSPKHDPELKRK